MRPSARVLFSPWIFQGKNVDGEEYEAISKMLTQVKWELPQVEQYRGEMSAPSFVNMLTNAPAAAPGNAAPAALMDLQKPDPAGPATEDQWKKASKMAA